LETQSSNHFDCFVFLSMFSYGNTEMNNISTRKKSPYDDEPSVRKQIILAMTKHIQVKFRYTPVEVSNVV